MLPVFEIFNVGTKEQCYPSDIPISVCSVFMCPNNGVCCQCWRFLMWAQKNSATHLIFLSECAVFSCVQTMVCAASVGDF